MDLSNIIEKLRSKDTKTETNKPDETKVVLNSGGQNIPLSPRRILNALSPRTLRSTLEQLSPRKRNIIKDIAFTEEVEEKKLELPKRPVNTQVSIIDTNQDTSDIDVSDIEIDKQLVKEYSESEEDNDYFNNFDDEELPVDEDMTEKTIVKINKKEKIEDKIEEILKSNYYELEERIIVNTIKNKQSYPSVWLVRCISPRGDILYVDLDIDSDIIVNEDDITLHETGDRINIPTSIKSGIISNIPEEVRGAVIDCDYGLYLLIKGTDEYIEKSLMVTTDYIDINYDYINPIPIVRLSKIMEDAESITNSVELFNKRFVNNSIKKYTNVSKKLNSELEILFDKYNSFDSRQKLATNELIDSIKFLQEMIDMIEQDLLTDSTARDNEKYDAIRFNIVKRNELFSELLKIHEYVDDATIKVVEMTKNFTIMQNYIDENFGNLNHQFIME